MSITAPLDQRSIDLPHECEPSTEHTSGGSGEARKGRRRFVGVDAARGIALIGMFAVHTISSATPEGDLTLTWQLSSGKSSALFAVLGGVGIAFMTGRTHAPRGAAWARTAVTPLVRGLLILAFGLLLGYAVSSEDADVILPYLGAMFIASALLLPLRSKALIGLGLGWAVVAPVLSYLLREPMQAAATTNLNFGDVLADPARALTTIVLTGFFPVLTWMAYICIGMGVGRADLSSRRVVAWLVGGGLALTAFASSLTWLFAVLGGREQLAQDVAGHTSLETFTEYLVWGGDGSLPADSPWWLGVNAPHTGTPLDLLYTSGISLAVIGLCLALSLAMGPLLHVLAAPGSMTLTLYSMHLLLLAPLRELPDFLHFLVQVLLLVTFALAWSSRFSKGPLEWVVATITHAVAPRRRGRHATPRGTRQVS